MSRVINPPSFDAMFDVLSAAQRRRILLAVADHNPRDEDEFAPDDFASAEADDDDLERLKTELYHVHLPKLAENGYIEWDSETQTIRRGANFDDIAPVLRLINDHHDEVPEEWL